MLITSHMGNEIVRTPKKTTKITNEQRSSTKVKRFIDRTKKAQLQSMCHFSTHLCVGIVLIIEDVTVTEL